jgi:hypothetical protein
MAPLPDIRWSRPHLSLSAICRLSRPSVHIYGIYGPIFGNTPDKGQDLRLIQDYLAIAIPGTPSITFAPPDRRFERLWR